MAGDKKAGKRAPGEDISYGEAARPASPGRKAGVIDSERDAREESEREERKPAGGKPPLKTDEERIAERQGKAGTGDLTDFMSESERHGGIPDDEANH